MRRAVAAMEAAVRQLPKDIPTSLEPFVTVNHAERPCG